MSSDGRDLVLKVILGNLLNISLVLKSMSLDFVKSEKHHRCMQKLKLLRSMPENMPKPQNSMSNHQNVMQVLPFLRSQMEQ